MDWYSQEKYCKDLPTVPVPDIGIVLVSGAAGYTGGRLVPELIERGYRVRVMVRKYSEEHTERWPEAEIVIADALNVEQLRWVLKDVSVAYYLINSMFIGKKDLAEMDIQAVTNFRMVAEERKLKRIIYLGAMGETNLDQSSPEESHISVANILMQGKVPTTVLQAAMIFGSGSASFEVLESIVRNSPVYFNPSWIHTRCQPIGIRDVIKYLVGVLETEETIGKRYDIGCDDALSYREMMKIMIKLLRKRRLFLPSPFSSIRLYSYITSLISPVPAQIIAGLMESVKRDIVVRESSIKKLINFKTIRFKVILLRSLSREEHDKIATRWSDSYPPAHELSMKFTELSKPPRFLSAYSTLTDKDASAIFKTICGIGGKQGWFYTNWLWRIRGSIDRILLGVGMSRGRRSADSLRINDVIDFWRVEDLIRNKRLLLRAEMRLPGKAWLEFKIEKKSGQNKLSVIAYFQTNSIAGKLYWYSFLPFHYFIFKDILKQLPK